MAGLRMLMGDAAGDAAAIDVVSARVVSVRDRSQIAQANRILREAECGSHKLKSSVLVRQSYSCCYTYFRYDTLHTISVDSIPHIITILCQTVCICSCVS